MLHRTCSAVRALMCRANAGSSAGRITPHVSRRSRAVTSGITSRGACGATTPPARSASRSIKPKLFGIPARTSRAKRSAARVGSVRRVTSSVSASVNSFAASSLTIVAMRRRRDLAERVASRSRPRDSLNNCSASETARSTRPSSAATAGFVFGPAVVVIRGLNDTGS